MGKMLFLAIVGIAAVVVAGIFAAGGFFAPGSRFSLTQPSSGASERVLPAEGSPKEESQMVGTNPIPPDGLNPGQSRAAALGLKPENIETVLPKDAIPAILEPKFVSVAEAEAVMRSPEQVLTLSIQGDHRAYPLHILSLHEIVNDVVGGSPVAVTY